MAFARVVDQKGHVLDCVACELCKGIELFLNHVDEVLTKSFLFCLTRPPTKQLSQK